MSNSPPTTHRISEYHKWAKEECLKLSEPFQRKPVWSEKNKSYLMDSILKGFPVPEVYVQVKTDKEGHTDYIVVDGQQRIRAILDFIEGEYEILESESQEYGGKEFKTLPDGIKKDFWDYPLVTRELKTDSIEEIKHIFKRLNKYVVPLNSQELRNATYSGEFINLVNSLTDNEFWTENKIMSPATIKRMLDAEFISELFIAMMNSIQTKSREGIDGFYKQYDINIPNKDEWVKKYRKTLDVIQDIFSDIKSTRWKNKADFYSLFLAIQDLLENYIFPAERYEEIADKIIKFDKEISLYGENSKDTLAKEYYASISKHTTSKENRAKRHNNLRKIIIPFLIARDKKRNFNEEERRILWMVSNDKKCAICGNEVKWEDYEIDHIKPYSKGGFTELKNSQITHKKCNASKSDKE